ncbi:hypothetical protein [Burkholderia contaminans]|nr:hypothetical protein [Burkholderia contaminans]
MAFPFFLYARQRRAIVGASGLAALAQARVTPPCSVGEWDATV